MEYRIRRSALSVSALAFSGLAYAGPDWVEGNHGGDAGSVPTTSQTTTGGALRRISGTLSGGTVLQGLQSLDLQDMYLIRIDDPSSFFATTVPNPDGGGSADFDTKLWLFNASGIGVVGNDDTSNLVFLGSSVATGSTLGPFACDETESSVPGPGLYYIAISKNYVPFSDTGPIFNFDDQDVCGPGELSGPDGPGGSGPITGWSDNIVDFDIQVDGGRAGAYSKTFSLAGLNTVNPQIFSNIGALADASGFADWNMSWNFGSDNDPGEGQASLGSGFTIENSMPDVADPSANHLKFYITLRMKLKSPTIASVLGGNAAITLLTRPSMSSNAGQLSSLSQPVWSGRLNDSNAASLFSPSFVLSSPATPFTGSTTMANATLPTFASVEPIQTIGVRMEFDLSPGEKASFVGAFALLPLAPVGPDDGDDASTYTIYLEGVSPAVPLSTLKMDLEHGHCPNLFRPDSNGILNADLIGSATRDVHDIDISSVRLSRTDGIGGEVTPAEGPQGPHSTYQDKTRPYTGQAFCGCQTLGADGYTDLWMKFQSALVSDVLELGDLSCGTYVELQLTGRFTDNTTFVARDCIQIAHDNNGVDPGCGGGALVGTGGPIVVRCAVPGTWIDADMVDAFIDDGGYSNFDRYYPHRSVVTLTAPQISGGQMFRGWRIDGKTVVKKANLAVTVDNKAHTYEALYVAVMPTNP